MNIKTITCHEVYNYGASLQEYALLYYLNSNGHKAEAIHYKPWYISTLYGLFTVTNQRFDKPIIKQLYLLAKMPGRILILKRKWAFDEFSKEYIPTGNILYQSNEDLIQNLPDADAFICGSDQIWNSFLDNGYDKSFYLNFVPRTKIKISYAASFAVDQIADDVKSLVKNNVSTFDAISVRETSGIYILNELGIHNACQVLDPVFLLPASHWEKKFITSISEEFIFVYDFDCNPLIKEIALALKREKGYKIYTINQNISYADKNFFLKGPKHFLSLVKNARFNITNSFHALAFSLIFNKQFVVVNREEKINTRMRDLLQTLNLEQLVSNFEQFSSLELINYDEINQLLAKNVTFSKNFLLNSLNNN